MVVRGYSTFPKVSALLEHPHQIILCYIQDTRWWGGVGSYSSAEKQSAYSTAPPVDWSTRTLVKAGLTPLQRCSQCILRVSTANCSTKTVVEGGSYLSAEKQSVYSIGHLLGAVLPLCREAVGVFYSPLQPTGPPGHSLMGFTPLQRCNLCILHSTSQLVHQDTSWGTLNLCREEVGVFYSPSRMSHRTLVWGWVLTLCRNAVGVFYSLLPAAMWARENFGKNKWKWKPNQTRNNIKQIENIIKIKILFFPLPS